MQATDKDWAQLQGKFLINGSPSSVVVYLEGPPAGTDILLNSLVVKHAPKTPPSIPPAVQVSIEHFHLELFVQTFFICITDEHKQNLVKVY